MQTFSGFRSLSPSYAALVQCEIFCPSHLTFGDAYIFPLFLSYDPLPLQNLTSHNLVSRRQSVVVLTVKIIRSYNLKCSGLCLVSTLIYSYSRRTSVVSVHISLSAMFFNSALFKASANFSMVASCPSRPIQHTRTSIQHSLVEPL